MSRHSLRSLTPLPELVKYRPLVLITGFLGAGKTTFLRELLVQVKLQNLTADVILNDYENAALDAETLHGRAASITALAASCACCDGLNDLVQLAVTVQASRSSVLVVELNGTADPLPLLEAFTLLECKLRFRPRWQVCVIDARHFGKRKEFAVLEILQLHTASHFIISHTTGLDRGALFGQVRSINPHASEITAARLSSHLAANIAAMHSSISHGPQKEVKLPRRSGHHLAHAFTGCQILLPPRVRKQTVLGWLAALPDSVYRAKALVSLVDSPEVCHLFERVAGDIMPNPLEVPISPRVPPAAVLIGPSLNPTALLEISHQHFGLLAKFPEEPSMRADHANH